MTKEKKKTIIFTVGLGVVALILILGLVFMELRQNGIIGSAESNKIIKEFNEYYNSKEREVILFASSQCAYCDLQKPILETVSEDYDMEYLAIDSIELSNSQRKEIINKLDIEGKTPTIAVVENGKVINKHVGFMDGTALVKFFIESKVLPKNAEYSEEKNLTFVNYDEYKDLIRDDNTHIIVIGQTSCSHCIAIKPALNSVAGDYDLTINYLNLTELSQEESEKFFESLKKIEYDDPDFVKDGSFGTPLTLILEDGKVERYISGSRTYSQLVREFTKAGLIKE